MSHNYSSTGHVILKFCQDMSKKVYKKCTKSIKNTAFENFKLFPENLPSNKIGSNNNKQIKLYGTDGE